MTIHTYHEPLPGVDRTEILELWAESWRRAGWEPVVHTRAEAAKHPKAGVYDRLIAKLPTVNPRDYEEACWRRWLVAAQVGGYWCDDDLVNCRVTPDLVRPQDGTGMMFTAWHEGEMPNTGLLHGTPALFENSFLHRIWRGSVPQVEEGGRPHTSDMFLWQSLWRLGAVQDVRGLMASYGSDLGAPLLVHCSHHHTHQAGTTQVAAMRELVRRRKRREAPNATSSPAPVGAERKHEQ